MKVVLKVAVKVVVNVVGKAIVKVLVKVTVKLVVKAVVLSQRLHLPKIRQLNSARRIIRRISASAVIPFRVQIFLCARYFTRISESDRQLITKRRNFSLSFYIMVSIDGRI